MIAGVLTMLTLVSTHAHATNNVTAAELATLPPYCDAKIGSQNPSAISHWDKALGHGNWIHMHHYCGGLIELNRYYKVVSAADRKGTLGRAVWEFDYTLNATSPDFSLRADAHFNRGRAQLLLGKDGQALNDFSKALELNHDMPPASIELAKLYKKQGKKDQALATLKSGLLLSPAHKGMRRNYEAMGGNLADIPESKLEPAAQTAAPTPIAAEAPKPSESPADPATAAPVVEPKIGNKTNPWCRFCPDGPDETVKPDAN
jgi:tetratricopeptide (TPR) repeat protein